MSFDDVNPGSFYTGYQWEKPGTPLDWQTDALCAQTDPEAFFPDKGGSTRGAKSVCAECTVREQCLAYALEHHIRDGIYGGLSPKERRGLRKDAA